MAYRVRFLNLGVPDRRGYFGRFGGRYVPEVLMPAILELEGAWLAARRDRAFRAEFADALVRYANRPSEIYFAERLTAEVGGARIYLKREDLNFTGAHKINNTVGQALLAKRMGKTRLIAETGAGQHGVATATAAARYGLACTVYMGEEDERRQKLNVYRMEMLGAEVRAVSSGSRTLKDAMNETLRDWSASVRETHYVIGSTAGPHPYPAMVRDLQSVIGVEARAQFLAREKRLPDACVACVGGGSNAMGLFAAFVRDEAVKLVGVEAAGEGLDSGRHAAPIAAGRPGVLHGSMSMLMDDDAGQVRATHSVSAGLDYPGVGPEHAYLAETSRAEYVTATDTEALDAFHLLARTEGILPALESAHAVAEAAKRARTMPADATVLVCLSGRGDKDVAEVARLTGRAPEGMEL